MSLGVGRACTNFIDGTGAVAGDDASEKSPVGSRSGGRVAIRCEAKTCRSLICREEVDGYNGPASRSQGNHRKVGEELARDSVLVGVGAGLALACVANTKIQGNVSNIVYSHRGPTCFLVTCTSDVVYGHC